MFKPVQYYKQTMESTDDTYLISPKCQLDSIDQLTEHMLTICVIISVSFIFLQPILGIANCLARKATTMHHRGVSYRIRCHQTCFIWIDRIQLIFAAVLALFFIAVTIYATFTAMKKRIEEQGWTEQNMKFIRILIAVYIFSFTSCIDIFLFQFCRDTCSNYFGRSKPWNRSNRNASSDGLNARNLQRLGLGSIGGESAVNYRHSDASTARTANRSVMCSVSPCLTVPEHTPMSVNRAHSRIIYE